MSGLRLASTAFISSGTKLAHHLLLGLRLAALQLAAVTQDRLTFCCCPTTASCFCAPSSSWSSGTLSSASSCTHGTWLCITEPLQCDGCSVCILLRVNSCSGLAKVPAHLPAAVGVGKWCPVRRPKPVQELHKLQACQTCSQACLVWWMAWTRRTQPTTLTA